MSQEFNYDFIDTADHWNWSIIFKTKRGSCFSNQSDKSHIASFWEFPRKPELVYQAALMKPKLNPSGPGDFDGLHEAMSLSIYGRKDLWGVWIGFLWVSWNQAHEKRSRRGIFIEKVFEERNNFSFDDLWVGDFDVSDVEGGYIVPASPVGGI